MSGGTVFCSATITTSAAGAVQCVNGAVAVPWTFIPDFDFTQLDAPTASGAFAAGFVLVGVAWAIGKSFGVVLSMFR